MRYTWLSQCPALSLLKGTVRRPSDNTGKEPAAKTHEHNGEITYPVFQAVAEHHVAPLPAASVKGGGCDDAFQDGLLPHRLSDPRIVQRYFRGVCQQENVLRFVLQCLLSKQFLFVCYFVVSPPSFFPLILPSLSEFFPCLSFFSSFFFILSFLGFFLSFFSSF